TFWYYAVKRATEICNNFPYQLEDGTFTAIFELVHHSKPDLQVLFKLFSIAAVQREQVGDDRLSKFDLQSVPMIAIGRCPKNDGLLFSNPSSGTIVSSIDYVFQPNIP
ncbi:MAG: hypothetical protein ACK53Y_06990, partial [bacterium]